MRILWVKVGGLWPLNTGGRLRSFHIISELSHRHRVTLLTTHGPADDPLGLAAALPRCERVTSIPSRLPKRGGVRFAMAVLGSWFSPLPVDLWKARVPALRREAHRLAGTRQVDVCVVDFLAAAPNSPLKGLAPTILFTHNVEHMIWKRLGATERRAWRRALLEIEWRKMRRYEGRACAAASLTLAVSEVDRAVLASLAPGAVVRAVPTGVDVGYFAPDGRPEAPARLVFTGSMDWYPNEDAVLYFVDDLLPRIRRDVPDVSLTVVGRNPTPRLRRLCEATGVHVTGTVDDVRPHVGEAAVCVVPLRVGGGTRLKIFEALAMGKAVVSTSVGAEGLPLSSGEHAVLADDPVDFARAVVRLVRHPEERRRLGLAGRRLVEERYSWGEVARRFEAHCQDVLAGRCADLEPAWGLQRDPGRGPAEPGSFVNDHAGSGRVLSPGAAPENPAS
jgi:glycosyltransferase involved in cell wall biosynthesis